MLAIAPGRSANRQDCAPAPPETDRKSAVVHWIGKFESVESVNFARCEFAHRICNCARYFCRRPQRTAPTHCTIAFCKLMSRIIVVTSGKGGVGKTTTTANLGMALAKRGNKVILIDADFGLRNLDLLLGLENRIVYTAVEVLAGECRLDQAIARDHRPTPLASTPAPHPLPPTHLTP